MNFLGTYTGLKFNYDNPTEDMVCIEDIARSLSMLCRYNGHVSHYYSVAQHSVLLSKLAPKGLEFDALMHDATEAYFGDFPSPLKNYIPELEVLEDKIFQVIASKYNLINPIPSDIKYIDRMICYDEMKAIVPAFANNPKWEGKIEPCSAEVAEQMFLKRFHELWRKK